MWISHLKVNDEELESEIEAEEMVLVGTTVWSDTETEQSLSMNLYSYSYDIDAEWMLPTEGVGAAGERMQTNHSNFPSSSTISLTFLYETADNVSVVSPMIGESPWFRMIPLRRTGEAELQIDMTKSGFSSKDIEIGLERCIQGTGRVDPLATKTWFVRAHQYECESSCIFSACGAVFNSMKRNMSVNISYSQGKLSTSQDISQIGLKITRDGALEFFVNGQSLGIAAEEVYKLGWSVLHQTTIYYPMIWLPLGNNKATIVAGGS